MDDGTRMGRGARDAQRWLQVGVVLFGMSTAQSALGQISGDDVNTAFDIQQAQTNANRVGGLATFGRLDEDFFLNITLRLSFDREYWGVGFQVPLRLRVIDNDPQDRDDIGSVIRREDWDQPRTSYGFCAMCTSGRPTRKARSTFVSANCPTSRSATARS